MIAVSKYKFIAINSQLAVAFSVLLLCIIAFPSRVHGESAISQGFKTANPNISTGSLISVTTKGGTIAGPANTNNVSNLVGVAGSKPLLELSNSNENNLKVIVSGSATTLVS